MVTPNAIVADRVRAAMKRAAKSQRAVAEQAGIAQVTLTRRLKGRSPFTAEELIAIAELVGEDPGDFLAGIVLGQANAS
jgi:transcriptional regulator with XRE-family HTH domain